MTTVAKMTYAYGTEGRLLEQLALKGELSISQLAKAAGVAYPTALYGVESFPFVEFEKAGREKIARIRNEDVDAIYPFLILSQANHVKKAELALAFLARKGFEDAMLGGEVALEAQLPVKDIEPDPEVEIRTRDVEMFHNFLRRTFKGSRNLSAHLLSNSRLVEDDDIRHSKKIGLLNVAIPEKLLVDAIAEDKSVVFIETVAESMANSKTRIDEGFLREYSRSRGVGDRALQELEAAKGAGFP